MRSPIRLLSDGVAPGRIARNSSPPVRARRSPGTKLSRYRRGHHSYQLVSDGMPKAIVRPFEPVDVQRKDRERLAREEGGPPIEGAPVRKSRQRICSLCSTALWYFRAFSSARLPISQSACRVSMSEASISWPAAAMVSTAKTVPPTVIRCIPSVSVTMIVIVAMIVMVVVLVDLVVRT